MMHPAGPTVVGPLVLGGVAPQAVKEGAAPPARESDGGHTRCGHGLDDGGHPTVAATSRPVGPGGT